MLCVIYFSLSFLLRPYLFFVMWFAPSIVFLWYGGSCVVVAVFSVAATQAPPSCVLTSATVLLRLLLLIEPFQRREGSNSRFMTSYLDFRVGSFQNTVFPPLFWGLQCPVIYP